MDHEQDDEQRDWTGYGSAQRTVIVTCYHVEDDHGVHRLLSMNDRAIRDLFRDQATFELHLAARYRSVELVGSGKVIVKPADQTAILPEGTQEIKRRVEELCAKHPGISWEPWRPERSNQQKPDETTGTPAMTRLDDDPSAPNDSLEKSSNELLAAISSAIFQRVALVVAGTLKQGGPAEANVTAVVAMFPEGVRALITARVDARVRVSRSVDNLEVSMPQSNEPAFLFQELTEPYDATHALHLVSDRAKDGGYTFVMVEFSAGKFIPKGWVNGEEAARSAAEGAKSATGRPPDFHCTTGKLPK